MEVAPVELDDGGLILVESDTGRRVRIDYRAVRAVAVVRIGEAAHRAAELVVDLVLSPIRPGERRVLRMRAETADASSLFHGPLGPTEAMRALLAELLDRTQAVPLPDPDSALGLEPRVFPSLDEWERELAERLRSEPAPPHRARAPGPG